MGQKVQGSSFSSTARDAPELAALQGLVAASSGVCCVAAASSHAPELAALQQASKTSYLFVCAWVPLQLQQLRSNSSNSAPAPAAPAPQPQLQLPLHSRPRSLELWRWSEGGVGVVGGR